MKNILLLMMLFIVGCGSAKKMRGTPASFVNGDVVSNFKISAERIPSLSMDGYHVVKLYFQNTNDFWLRVNSVEVEKIHNVPKYNVILGNDVKTWLKSMKLNFELTQEEAKKQKKEYSGTGSRDLQRVKEADYVLNQFSIPSGLQSEKWVLFQLPKGKKMSSFNMKVELIDRSSQVFKVELK